MGDAEVGAASSLESGDASGGLAASRALMEGGSLPPRKRLLAGLKQNGWLSTSPPPAGGESSPTGGGGGGYASAPAQAVSEVSCMGCSSPVETTGLRRIKRGGVVLRLCSACTLLYSKHMFCPHCLVMYHDGALLADSSKWLVCTKCRRSVHRECEKGKVDTATYVCLDCVNLARRQREANGVTGMRSKHGRPVPNFHGETASPIDFVSPALKKPRLHRERIHGDGSRFERHRPASTPSPNIAQQPPRKVVAPPPPAESAASVSPQEAAVAARNAATAAAKVAAAKKANAAAKASAAVKAAAAAKAALETAAHAKKAEAAAQAELRRKTGTSRARLEINVHSEPRRERSFKHEDGSRRPSVDDEELARQLHRVMNSSPRISRSMTPMRRKAKPETPSSGVSNSSAETVRAEQQHHHHHQFRQRPRSVTHKEFRRIESRVSRHEVTPIVDPTPPPPHEDLAVKSEAMDGVMGQDEASILFDALVEADGEGMHAAAPDRRPDYLQEILEAAVLSDAAMFTDAPHHELDTERPPPEPVPSLPLEPEVAPEPIAMQETVVHDVEMQEGAAAPDSEAPGREVSLPEPLSTKEIEEESAAVECKPSIVEAASPPQAAALPLEEADLSLPAQDTNLDSPESEKQASPATAPQQSG